MKKMAIIIILVFTNGFVFANDHTNPYNIIDDIIRESIESKYISGFSLWTSIRDDTIYSLTVMIRFMPGIYELRDTLYEILENEIIPKLYEAFLNIQINIEVSFPFSVIIVNNYDYDIDNRQRIINDIFYSTNGITIEQLFQNTMYGWFSDRYFGNSSEYNDRNNNRIFNNFNIFLEVLSIHFGVGNIISF